MGQLNINCSEKRLPCSTHQLEDWQNDFWSPNYYNIGYQCFNIQCSQCVHISVEFRCWYYLHLNLIISGMDHVSCFSTASFSDACLTCGKKEEKCTKRDKSTVERAIVGKRRVWLITRGVLRTMCLPVSVCVGTCADKRQWINEFI